MCVAIQTVKKYDIVCAISSGVWRGSHAQHSIVYRFDVVYMKSTSCRLHTWAEWQHTSEVIGQCQLVPLPPMAAIDMWPCPYLASQPVHRIHY